MRILFPLLSLLLLCAPLANASSIAIPIRKVGAPAVNLMHQSKLIDRNQAMDLKQRGVDLSQLNPKPDDVWQPTSYTAVGAGAPESPLTCAGTCSLEWNFPAEGAIVTYRSSLPSTRNLFRSRVVSLSDQPFQIIASLEGHAIQSRTAMLRKLGFPIPSPRYYSNLTVRFESLEDRESFLSALSDATLTARTRWIRELPETTPEVTLQDVTLEAGQIDIPSYQWGVIPASEIKGRRALRGLIVPLALLDVGGPNDHESVNLYSWEFGKVLDNSILLTHPYATNFGEVTFDDARWMARKIALLTPTDLREVILAGKYPSDISALLYEKLIARRNHMVQLFDLARELRPDQMWPEPKWTPKTQLSIGNVVNGKLKQAHYSGHAERFTFGDPLSPLRTSEVARFLAIEGISNAMSALALKVDKLLTISGVEDVASDHQNDLMNDFYKHMQERPNEPYHSPVGAWGGPLAGFSVAANRDVVSGTYYGSDSKVQLVDNLSAQASVGYFMGVDGLPVVTPSVTGNIFVQRNYLHVRPIADMKSAIKTDWKTLFIPHFMSHLKSLLYSGDDQTKVDESLKEFLEALKENELLVIIDSVGAGVRGELNIPIPLLMAPGLSEFNPSLSVSSGLQPTILRRTTFSRTKDGIQVYIQNARIVQMDATFDFNWWINILKLQHIHKKAVGHTKAFLLDREPDSAEGRRHLLSALRGLLHHHSTELLEDYFKEYELHHNVETDINSAKLLWWKWAGIEEKHRVTVAPPDYEDNPGSKNVRTLYSDRVTRIKGIDRYAFMSDILSAATKGTVSLSSGQGGYNPSASFLGNSRWVSSRAEAEITPGVEVEPVTIIEHHVGGWLLSRQGLFGVLDALEGKAHELNLSQAKLIRRDEFMTTNQLQLYEILSTLIVYPGAMKKLTQEIFEKKHLKEAVEELLEIEGAQSNFRGKDNLEKGYRSLNQWCAKPLRAVAGRVWKPNGYWEVTDNIKYSWRCLKPWMRRVLNARFNYRHNQLPKTPEGKVDWTNALFGSLEAAIDLPTLLNWLGKDNFYFQIKISGFRTHDENGDTTYLSDTVGSFDNKLGAGVFRDFANKYHILNSELSANYLSEGF